jgi:hypothetical protein
VPKLVPGFSEERVAIISIHKPKADQPPTDPMANPDQVQVAYDAVAFRRESNDWVIHALQGQARLAGVKVRSSDVKSRILEPVGRIKLTKASIVEINATDETMKSSSLDDAQATVVQLLDQAEQPIAVLRIGTEASRGTYSESSVRGTFVMNYKKEQKGANSIVLSEDTWTLDVDPNYWVDKQVLSLDQAKIKAITVENPKGKLSLEKKDGTWTANDKPDGVGGLRQFEVTSLLSRLSSLDCTEYVGPYDNRQLANYGLDKPEYTIKATTEDGKEYSIRIGKKVPDKQDSYAMVSEVENFYLQIGEWNVTPFQKDPKDFFDPAAAQDPAAGTEPKTGDETKDGSEPKSDKTDATGAGKQDPGGAGTGEPEKKGEPAKKNGDQ